MQHHELLDMQAAAADAQAMLVVLGGIVRDPSKASGMDYDYAASQLNKIKHNMASLSDDELITLHSEAAKLSEAKPDSEPSDNAAYLCEDTLSVMAYLDPERAITCYQRILDREDIETATLEFVPFGLVRLTGVVDERALPIWEQVFEPRFEIEEYAALAAGRVLDSAEAFSISGQTVARLRALVG